MKIFKGGKAELWKKSNLLKRYWTALLIKLLDIGNVGFQIVNQDILSIKINIVINDQNQHQGLASYLKRLRSCFSCERPRFNP